MNQKDETESQKGHGVLGPSLKFVSLTITNRESIVFTVHHWGRIEKPTAQLAVNDYIIMGTHIHGGHMLADEVSTSWVMRK